MTDLAPLSPAPAAAPAARAPQPLPPERLPPPGRAESSPRALSDHRRGAATGGERPPTERAARSAAQAEPPTLPRPRPDPDMLVGPPPAFQASILDLETDLRAKLAQLNAARSGAEARDIFRAAAKGQPPAAQPGGDETGISIGPQAAEKREVPGHEGNGSTSALPPFAPGIGSIRGEEP